MLVFEGEEEEEEEAFYLYQKLWDLLGYWEKVNNRDTMYIDIHTILSLSQHDTKLL